jgi:hypothetical protein
MSTFAIFVLLCVAALVVAWVVNALVGILSGEHPKDTGRLWSDIVLRVFAAMKFGFLGRFVGYMASTGWRLRVLYALGVLGIVAFLIRGCNEPR